MRLDLQTIVLLAVIALLAFMWLDSCNGKIVAENEAEAYASYKDTVMYYKDKNGEQIAYNKALEMDRELMMKLNDQLSEDIERLKLKKVTSFTTLETELRIDTVRVEMQLPCDEFEEDTILNNTYYNIDLKLTERGLTFNSIKVPNSQDIIVGTKKNGLFKKNEYIITVENSNPYMNVTGIQSYTLKPKPKWFEKWYVQGAVGFVIGFTASQQVK
jgi:hypothetical protein